MYESVEIDYKGETFLAPTGNASDYFVRCLRADDIGEGSRTFEEGAAVVVKRTQAAWLALAIFLGVSVLL